MSSADKSSQVPQEEPSLHNTLSIHVDIDEAATHAEAHAFCDELVEWIGRWMESHPGRGEWDPFVYAHKGSCEESDHCAGAGSLIEREILERAELRAGVERLRKELGHESRVAIDATRRAEMAEDRAKAAEARLAQAWDEGHRTPKERLPDNCHCNAWCRCECGCGEYGYGRIVTPNPYGSAHLRDLDDVVREFGIAENL